MMQTPSPFFRRSVSVLCLVSLSACVSTVPAPLENRSQQLNNLAVGSGAPSGPGYYTVQKGDTLYSIAMRHNQDYREIAAWNNLADAAVISVGQVLRIQPPEAMVGPGVSIAPVTVGTITEQPLDNNLKREPMVNKEPYSDAAYARAQGTAPPTVPATTPAATTPVATTPVATATTTTVTTPAPIAIAATSGLTWAWPSKGKIVSNFATANGIDIAGQAGDPILAAADGKVVYAGSGLRGYGQLVIIKHNETYLTAYAHNRKILVKEGQEVKRGALVAEMGNTDSDSVKLHFEVRKQGKSVDPLDFLPKR